MGKEECSEPITHRCRIAGKGELEDRRNQPHNTKRRVSHLVVVVGIVVGPLGRDGVVKGVTGD